MISDRYDNWFTTSWNNQTGMSDNSGSLTLNVYECQNVGSISGTKFEDINGNGQRDDEGGSEPGLSSWTIQLKDMSDNVLDSFVTDSKGDYWFDQLIPGTYKVCEVEQTDWVRTYPSDSNCQTVSVDPGQNVQNINFGNAHYGSVTVVKFNDANENGIYNDTESPIGGWNITLGSTTITTDANGLATFNNILAGTYDISETIPAGSNWVQTGIYCDGDGTFNGSQVVVVPGKNINCYIGNFELKPVISLTKANNIVGSTSAGAIVTYSVIVSNDGNTELNGVDITDFLPGGFAYVVGNSKVGDVSVSDPTISSSGSVLYWENIGNISPTKTITLTYQAKINSDAADGIYTNYAVSKADYGITQTQPLVGFVKVAYAQEIETAKEIESNLDSSAVTIGNSLSYGGTLGGGQVLGASTELPATGSPTWILLGAVGMITCGAFLNIYSRKERRKYEKN